MTMTDYMLKRMKENEGLWTTKIDNGKTVIINHNGQPCYGIQEENGQIVTAETLLHLYSTIES